MPYEDLRKTEYSADWKGPLEKRSTTDLPFLVAFLVLMAFWAVVGIYALTQGDLRAQLAPVDSHNQRCGIEVAGAPRLVFFDLSKFPRNGDDSGRPFVHDNNGQFGGQRDSGKICREECPTTDWHYQIGWDEQTVEEIREKMICEPGVDVSTKTKMQLETLINENKCAKWYLKSSSLVGRCVPESIPSEFIDLTLSESELHDVRNAILASVWGGPIVAAAINTRGPVLGLTVLAAFLCLAYVFLLKWIAFPCALISSALLFAVYSYFTYYFSSLYNETNDSTFLVYAIILGVLAGVTVLIVLFLFERMRVACELIKEASEAVVKNYATLMFPILPWLIQLTATVYFIVVAMYLCTFDDMPGWLGGLLFTVHVTGYLWFYFFVTAAVEMSVAFVFATWYWTFNKQEVPVLAVLQGASKTFRYHLGTVAFGSLLITICRMIRILLTACQRSRGPAAILLICVRWLMSYVEKFLKFMNRNAYIMCAIYGKGLCSSASAAMSLILRNALTAILLNNMVSWVLWLGKFLIAGTTALLALWCYADTMYDQERFHAVWLAALGSYLVADMFCTIYIVGVDCIFICFLEDRERNDGSPSRPYYMSQRLRTLLHKDV